MHSDEQLSKAAFLLRSTFWLPELRDLGNNIISGYTGMMLTVDG
jgi:hypothetical protein